MLSNEEKLRIQLEETYRNELKQALPGSSKKSLGGKIWPYINSTIGVWFLSTCVVGIITSVYTKQQEKDRKAEAAKQANIEHARQNASLVSVLLPYLASTEEKQWQLAIEVTKYLKAKGELPGELKSALEGIVIAARNTDTSNAKASAEQKAKVNAAAAVIDLDNSHSQQGAARDPNTLPPRVYIQIADESQRASAKRLQSVLSNQNFIAPGIENVGRKSDIKLPGTSEVRYYHPEEKRGSPKINFNT